MSEQQESFEEEDFETEDLEVEGVEEEALDEEGGDQESELSPEEKAQLMGWYPDHPAGLSAEEFMAKTEKHLGLSRKENEKLWGVVEELKSEIKQSRAVQDQMAKFFQSKEEKAMQAGYDRAIRDYKAKMEQAVEDADRPAFDEASRKIEELQKRKAESRVDPIVPEENPIVGVIQQHAQSNPDLFDMETKRNIWKTEFEAAGRSGKSLEDSMKTADKAVKQMFGMKRQMPGPTSGGGKSGGGSRKLSSIPGAQEAYNQLKRQFPDLTVDEYLAEIGE